jgi:hypothetical protein
MLGVLLQHCVRRLDALLVLLGLVAFLRARARGSRLRRARQGAARAAGRAARRARARRRGGARGAGSAAARHAPPRCGTAPPPCWAAPASTRGAWPPLWLATRRGRRPRADRLPGRAAPGERPVRAARDARDGRGSPRSGEPARRALRRAGATYPPRHAARLQGALTRSSSTAVRPRLRGGCAARPAHAGAAAAPAAAPAMAAEAALSLPARKVLVSQALAAQAQAGGRFSLQEVHFNRVWLQARRPGRRRAAAAAPRAR